MHHAALVQGREPGGGGRCDEGRVGHGQRPTGGQRGDVLAACVLGDDEAVGAVAPGVDDGREVEVADRGDHAHGAQKRVGVERPDHRDDNGPALSVLAGVGRLGAAGRQASPGAVPLRVDGLSHAASRGPMCCFAE